MVPRVGLVRHEVRLATSSASAARRFHSSVITYAGCNTFGNSRSIGRRLAAFQSPPEPLKNVRRVGFQATLHEPPDEASEHATQHINLGSIEIDQVVARTGPAAQDHRDAQRRVDIAAHES